MGIETSTTITGLNNTWPLGSDPKSEGDNHIRLLKSVLQLRFDDSGATIKHDKPVETAGIVAGSLNGGAFAGLRNLIDNGSFRVNQRAFAGGAIGAGIYGYDRWKADVAGVTYTVAAGVATITAGALLQVIEGPRIEVTGNYTLSWVGTATAQVNGVAVVNGAVAALTAGTNATLRFTGGTVSNVQLEFGAPATAFERRPLSIEENLCMRFYEKMLPLYVSGPTIAGFANTFPIPFKVRKRAVPTMSPVAAGVGSGTMTTASTVQVSIDGFGYQIGNSGTGGGSAIGDTYAATADL